MTSRQLEAVLDLDLWVAPRPGLDEVFDADRFGEWLESLAEAGESEAALVIARMDLALVSGGLSRFVRVCDQAAVEAVMTDDEAPSDWRDSNRATCEIGGYVVTAHRDGGWDAVVSVLAALETEAPECFHAVMRGCRTLSDGVRELDGLDDLLAESDQWLHDLRLARERRHEAAGHTSAADARAFLQMARARTGSSAATGMANPLHAAHVRDYETARVARASHAPMLPSAAADAGSDADPLLLRAILAEIDPEPSPDRRLLGEGPPLPAYVVRMRTLLETACDVSIETGLARHRELAFLANVLVSGSSLQGRAFTAQEAMTAALATAHLGLDSWSAAPVQASAAAEGPGAAACPDTWLVDHDMIGAFELGWSVLHEQVGMAAARSLRHVAGTMRCTDPLVAEGLGTLWRALRTHCDAGTPWGVRDALDVVALLDLPAWTSLLGLLGECPVMPHALRAVIDGHVHRVSATDFDFISCRTQIDDVRTFLSRLPALLG